MRTEKFGRSDFDSSVFDDIVTHSQTQQYHANNVEM